MKGCIAGFIGLLHDYISQGGNHGPSLQSMRMPNDERLEEIGEGSRNISSRKEKTQEFIIT